MHLGLHIYFFEPISADNSIIFFISMTGFVIVGWTLNGTYFSLLLEIVFCWLRWVFENSWVLKKYSTDTVHIHVCGASHSFLLSVPFPPVVQSRDANTKKKVIGMLFYLKLKDSRYIEKITIQTATLDFFKTSLIMFPTTGTNWKKKTLIALYLRFLSNLGSLEKLSPVRNWNC